MTIKDKVLQYARYKGMNTNQFCKEMGLSSAFFIRNGGMTTDVLQTILSRCDDLSAEWLLRDEGSMLRDTGKPTTDDEPEGNTANYIRVITNQTYTIKTLTDTNSQLVRKITSAE